MLAWLLVSPRSSASYSPRPGSAILYGFSAKARWQRIAQATVTLSMSPNRKLWFHRLLRFDRRRWQAFALILALIYALALFGVRLSIFIPILGTPLFLASLTIWYIPGVLFGWTGLFIFHEFGAAPTGWAGHLVMLAFYACLAGVASWPCGRAQEHR
jgi:hypothetical protein